MAVYFIRCESTGLVKIGFAADPEKRLRDLQTGSPGVLSLEATMPGFKRDEKALHGRFRGARVRGEWFNISADDVRSLASEPLVRPKKPERPKTFDQFRLQYVKKHLNERRCRELREHCTPENASWFLYEVGGIHEDADSFAEKCVRNAGPRYAEEMREYEQEMVIYKEKVRRGMR